MLYFNSTNGFYILIVTEATDPSEQSITGPNPEIKLGVLRVIYKPDQKDRMENFSAFQQRKRHIRTSSSQPESPKAKRHIILEINNLTL